MLVDFGFAELTIHIRELLIQLVQLLLSFGHFALQLPASLRQLGELFLALIDVVDQLLQSLLVIALFALLRLQLLEEIRGIKFFFSDIILKAPKALILFIVFLVACTRL